MVSKITALQDSVSNSTKNPPWMISYTLTKTYRPHTIYLTLLPYRPEQECCHVASKLKISSCKSNGGWLRGACGPAAWHGGGPKGRRSDDSSFNIQVQVVSKVESATLAPLVERMIPAWPA